MEERNFLPYSGVKQGFMDSYRGRLDEQYIPYSGKIRVNNEDKKEADHERERIVCLSYRY